MPSETKYARSGEFHIAYQVIGDGPIDLLWIPTWSPVLSMSLWPGQLG